MAVVGNRITRKSAGSKNYKGTARGDDFQISKAQKQLDAINAKINKRGDKGKYMPFENQKSRLQTKIRDLRGVKKLDPKTVKVGKMSTPNRTLAKGESKIRSSQMNKGMAPASANPEVKKRKARRNAAGTMGQMASGGKVKKCKVDGIARKGKTKAKRK